MEAKQSESDSDEDLLEGDWSLNKRKKMKQNSCSDMPTNYNKKNIQTEIVSQSKMFEELKKKSSQISLGSSLRAQKTELRRSRKILKRALADPWIKHALEEKDDVETANKEKVAWQDVKPYLSVNEHLQGPVSHGSSCGPKTELECQIEECIQEGDFEKAELLSDTLANREFAVKIAQAFRARKYTEEQEKLKAQEKLKKKKIRWMFDPKEKWQMKGNM